MRVAANGAYRTFAPGVPYADDFLISRRGDAALFLCHRPTTGWEFLRVMLADGSAPPEPCRILGESGPLIPRLWAFRCGAAVIWHGDYLYGFIW